MAIEELIRDTTPKGLIAPTQHKAQRRPLRGQAEEEWIYAKVEPIVSVELWEACNGRSCHTNQARFPGPRPEHLFGGRVRCTCGTKMYARKQTGNTRARRAARRSRPRT